jgi:heme iron utilization protein
MPQDKTPPADAETLAEALRFLGAQHGALAYSDPDGWPGISRIALGQDGAGLPVTLISALSQHHAGLAHSPACALMLGEPGAKGDPLTHPRLMIRATAAFVPRHSPDHAALREIWLQSHPKAKLYIDFADFSFVRLVPVSALFNGGFGRAFTLRADQIRHPAA